MEEIERVFVLIVRWTEGVCVLKRECFSTIERCNERQCKAVRGKERRRARERV